MNASRDEADDWDEDDTGLGDDSDEEPGLT
jgi:hypothetical protein